MVDNSQSKSQLTLCEKHSPPIYFFYTDVKVTVCIQNLITAVFTLLLMA